MFVLTLSHMHRSLWNTLRKRNNKSPLNGLCAPFGAFCMPYEIKLTNEQINYLFFFQAP